MEVQATISRTTLTKLRYSNVNILLSFFGIEPVLCGICIKELNMNNEWLSEKITYISALKNPSDAQKLLLELAKINTVLQTKRKN